MTDHAAVIRKAIMASMAVTGEKKPVPFRFLYSHDDYDAAHAALNALVAERDAALKERDRLIESGVKLLDDRLGLIVVPEDRLVRMRIRAEAAETERDRYWAALADACDVAIWMSGSPSFGPEGEAHEGWVKAREKLHRALDVLCAVGDSEGDLGK